MADSCLRNREFESPSIKVRKWESKLLGVTLWIVKIGKEFWFFGKEVAEALDYTKPKNAIRDHVELRDKKSIKEVLGSSYKVILEKNLMGPNLRPIAFFQKLHPDYILIKEIGLYSLCTKSRKENAFPFQRWIFETIQKIRETGSYTLPGESIENPLSLIDKISNLEKEIKTLREEAVRTCDKEIQTEKSVIVLDGSFKDLEERIVKFFKKTKISFKKTIEEAKIDLERTIKAARLDLERSIEEARFDLERSIRKASSSSLSSSPRLYYSDSG